MYTLHQKTDRAAIVFRDIVCLIDFSRCLMFVTALHVLENFACCRFCRHIAELLAQNMWPPDSQDLNPYDNKKHLKNVGPIRHCEPPLHCVMLANGSSTWMIEMHMQCMVPDRHWKVLKSLS